MLKEYEKHQPIAFDIMKKAIERQKFNHAYLIETNNYYDAENMITSFIKEILFIDGNEKYINKAVDENNYPELKIIEPDGNWIRKEQLIQLQEEFNKKALLGSKKIYIIKEADKLNNISANSILKFLEEPVIDIIAILICDNRNRMLDTIRSRCQIISLVNKKNDIEEDYCTKIGHAVFNNKKEAESFIFNENSKLKIETVINFIKYYELNNTKTLFFINKYWYNDLTTKEDTTLGLKIMLNFYLDVLNKKLGRTIIIFNEDDSLITKVAKNDINNIATKIEAINRAIKKQEFNTNLNLLMDKLIIEMDGCL